MTRPPNVHTAPDPATVLTNKDIVIISSSEWDGPKRIRQYLTEELARRGNRVLFVESYYTLSKLVKNPSLQRAFRFLRGPREIQENLFILPTFPFIPAGEYSKSLSSFNWNVERLLIKHAMKRLGFDNIVLWVFAYHAGSLVGTLGERVALYFCNDAFAYLVASKTLQRQVAILERQLLAKVDFVFTVSDKLTQEKSQYHTRVHTIYHGVDYSLFERVLANRGTLLPSDLPRTRPMIGYSGVIRYMLDLDLIEFLAEKEPQWSFVFVGPIRESNSQFYSRIAELQEKPNIYFVGPKAPEEVPLYINSFDVCLLPYLRGVVSTYYSAPLKFYEYLAAGKPVVSTVGPYNYDEGIVLNSESKHGFLFALETALESNTPENMERRKTIAKQNSWEERLDQIDRILKQMPGR